MRLSPPNMMKLTSISSAGKEKHQLMIHD